MLFSVGVVAQAGDSPRPTDRARAAPVFNAYFENDSFTGTDQHYTNGVKLSWLSADLVDWGQTGWRKTCIELLPFVNRNEGQKNLGVALGQNIYTPLEIRRINPEPADRPYAGWLYLELAFVSKTPAISDTIAIQVGLVGPHSLAEDSQRIVHHWSGSVRPRGWDYQLRDELGVNMVYEPSSWGVWPDVRLNSSQREKAMG